MDIKIKISKKILTRLALFIALAGGMALLDTYLEKNPVLEEIEAQSHDNATDSGTVYMVASPGSFTAKTSTPKTPSRKLNIQLHDKHIRKYHQLRNYQVFKVEEKAQSSPLIQSYHYLVFEKHFFSHPDDVPLNA